jgi:hypothetical protein
VDGDEMAHWIQAEDFTFGSATTLTDVRFWSVDRGGYNGSVTWSIYADDAVSNQPGSLLFRGNTVPVTTDLGTFGFQGIGHQELQNDFSVGSIVLAAGKYWLGLHNGLLSEDSIGQYYWKTTSDNSTTRGKEDITPFDVGGWDSTDLEHAFVLFSNVAAVPEPGVPALLATGLAAFGFRRHRRIAKYRTGDCCGHEARRICCNSRARICARCRSVPAGVT